MQLLNEIEIEAIGGGDQMTYSWGYGIGAWAADHPYFGAIAAISPLGALVYAAY